MIVIHHTIGFLREIWFLLGALSPYLLLGFGIAGILHIFIPEGMIEKHLGGKGFLPIVKAAIFGVPLPICSCGVIPIAASLRKEGASKASTLSFLVSTPTSGVDSILATYSLFGFVFAYFLLTRPVKKSLEAIEEFLPDTSAPSPDAETETILLARALTSLYPTIIYLCIMFKT